MFIELHADYFCLTQKVINRLYNVFTFLLISSARNMIVVTLRIRNAN